MTLTLQLPPFVIFNEAKIRHRYLKAQRQETTFSQLGVKDPLKEM